jgi:hypothetical protein
MKKLYIRPLLIELFLNKIVGFFNGSSSTHNVEHFAKKNNIKIGMKLVKC